MTTAADYLAGRWQPPVSFGVKMSAVQLAALVLPDWPRLFRAYLQAQPGQMMTADDFAAAAAYVRACEPIGDDSGPAMLRDAFRAGRIDGKVVRAVLVGVWQGAEFPQRCLTRRDWVGLFRLAAFAPPAEPLLLYRGAEPYRARGMAWTTEPMRAGWFGNRLGFDLQFDPFIRKHGTPDELERERDRLAAARKRAKVTGERLGHVYDATVEPAGILAVVDDLVPDGRGESEVIVDPAYLPRKLRRW